MDAIRTCLGCRERAGQSELLRLVRRGDEVVDATRPRLEGRGGYLHRRTACLELALRRRAIPRAFGAGAELSTDVTASIVHEDTGWDLGWVAR